MSGNNRLQLLEWSCSSSSGDVVPHAEASQLVFTEALRILIPSDEQKLK